MISIIAARIREARIAAGLTQEALAARVGVSKAAVAQWEAQTDLRTEPTLSNLRAVAIATSVTADFLLGCAMPGERPAPPADLDENLRAIQAAVRQLHDDPLAVARARSLMPLARIAEQIEGLPQLLAAAGVARKGRK